MTEERERAPRHPGAILREMLAGAAELNQSELATRLGISRPRLNELLHGRRAVTPDTALRLARLLGAPAEYWMAAQASWDLHLLRGSRDLAAELERIEPLSRREREHTGPPDYLPSTYLSEFLEQRGLLDAARRYAQYRADVERLAAASRTSTERATRAAAPDREV